MILYRLLSSTITWLSAEYIYQMQVEMTHPAPSNVRHSFNDEVVVPHRGGAAIMCHLDVRNLVKW
jgi:hypothetical protein